MKYTGIKFFMDLVDVEYDQLLAAFSFYSGFDSSNIVYPEKWSGSNSATGYLNVADSSFYSNGTGIFNGSLTMSLSGQNFALTEDSTLMLSFQKLRTGNEILLSSTTGNSFNSYQGYCLGVNDANKLYFKYWNPVEGPFTFTYSKILSDKNLIILDRTNSVITIGKYDNNNFQYDVESFTIYENAFKNNEYGNLFLGGSRNNIGWANNGARNFSGYIDKFYFFNNTPFIYKDLLTSGLYSVATGYEGFSETFCFDTGFYTYSGFSYTGQTGVFVSGFSSGITGVTGYATGISGYSYSGITGYSGKYLGTYYDNCGNPKDIYEQVSVSGLISGNYSTIRALTGTLFITGAIDISLTGFISGSGLIEVTGQVCDTIFTLTGNALYDVDIDYLSSLSYSEISLLSNIDKNNMVEYYYSPYEYNTKNFNIDLNYDNVDNNFYSPNFDIRDKNILLFAQGEALASSGGELVQSGYETIKRAYLDYFTTGNSVEVNSNFNDTNQLFYDYYKDRPNYYVLPFSSGYKSGDRVLFGYNAPNTGLEDAFVFLNGQKLINGIDYTIDPLLLVGGVFTAYRSVSRQRLISLNDANGSIDSKNNLGLSGFSSTIRDVILDNNKFVIGGDFTGYSGVKANRIIRIFPDGKIDRSFSGEVNNGSIYQIKKFKNKYLIVGDFTGVNNIRQNRCSLLNIDGSVDTSFMNPTESGFSSIIYDAKIDLNNNIYFAGSFTNYNNIPISRLARFDENGILDTNFNKNIFNNFCYNINLYDDGLLIGGVFSSINGSGNYRNLSKLDYINGNVMPEFQGTGLNAGAFSISTDIDNNILVGGNFTSMSTSTGTAATTRFVVLTPSGTINYSKYDPSTGPGALVSQIVKQKNNKILIVGNFTTYKGSNYQRILRLNSDYTVDTTFSIINSGFDNNVNFIISYDAINLNINGIGSGIFMAKEYPLNFIYISGNNGFFNTLQNYNNNSSLVFLNGLRQKLNNNYVENSKLDLISGSFYEPSQKNIIYNNTDDFFV